VQEFLLDRAPGAITWGAIDPYAEGSPEITLEKIAVWTCDVGAAV